MSKLPDVRGRITYISSHAKQENLYAVYETAYRHYWTELAKCNQQEFQKSGTEGKCIEEREFIIALPESFFVLYEQGIYHCPARIILCPLRAGQTVAAFYRPL